MLAVIDPFSVGTTIGLVVAGTLAALSKRRKRQAEANGDTIDGKLDRVDRRLERMEERGLRTEKTLERVERKVDRHVAEHAKR